MGRTWQAAVPLVVAAWIAVASTPAPGQVGQTAMTPAGGIVNRAVGGVQSLNANGPGWMYYGLNAADRGLGYRGSYMTLGGYVPAFEDDLGGLWAADLRGHLSVYGGFFSNVGAVRKQFLGGSLFGVGIYWDYDGDMNQYATDTFMVGPGRTATFAGGQVYNQVGVSLEWLNDYGGLRSNGYFPVGTTAQLMGPFVGNAVLCQNGVNAGLTGTDLEVGLYVPALADWAGMVSVGGYAFGNARYQFPSGQDAVPWFGGVYTRLDMTLLRNWDFSLQANNDSYFDWTGFARLTYRMGGSRRRNVPDQMEQPMMRNEHIVRGRQTPEVAINPATGLPWQIFHVDNTASPGGNGTAEAPFATIGGASTAAVSPYDVVYLHAGTGAQYVTPAGGFSFNAPHQYLVGAGSPLVLPTLGCEPQAFFAGFGGGGYPTVTNPVGAAVVMNQPNVTVTHVRIAGSPIGISDGPGPGGIATPATGTISDVIIDGNGGPSQRGIQIAHSTGTFIIDRVRLSNLTNDGLVVSAAGGRANVTNSSFTGITGAAIRASGPGAIVTAVDTGIAGTVGTAVAAAGASSVVALNRVTIADTTGNGVVASGTGAAITVVDSQITNTSGAALATTAGATGASITATKTRIEKAGNPGVLVAGNASTVTLDASSVRETTGAGVLVSGSAARINMTNASQIEETGGNGITLTGSNAFADISGRSVIRNVGADGINSTGASIHLLDSVIQSAADDGIDATNVSGDRVVWVQGSEITNVLDSGIVALNSNLRVEQLDPSNPISRQTRITNAAAYGILVSADVAAAVPYRVLVESTGIAGVVNAIGIIANGNAPGPPIPTIDFTARRNSITATGNGINVSGVFSQLGGAFPGAKLSEVNVYLLDNTITAGTVGIQLNVAGDSTLFPSVPPPDGPPAQAPAGNLPINVAALNQLDLSNLNNGATTAVGPGDSIVNFNAFLVPLLPPPPPTPP